MAHFLPDVLFEISGQAPPPNKNFYHFFLTKSEVIWRWWKISLRSVDRYSRPGELKEAHCDFLDDTWLQSEVREVFGHKILEYSKALCQGRYDYLERLSDSLLLRIINCLELEDVGQLERTSRRFRKLCGSEEFWQQAVRQRCNTVSSEVTSLACEVGWRSIFFTNKLHLQKLLSRRRLKTKEAEEGKLPEPDTKAEENLHMEAEMKLLLDSEEDSSSAMFHHLSCEADNAVHGADASLHPDAGRDSVEIVSEQFMTQSMMGDFTTKSVKTLS